MRVLLSFLIPTLESRHLLFLSLRERLQRQINKVGLEHAVEIISISDGGEMPIGEKRNGLLDRARGDFVAFIDDDDWVSDDYVERVMEVIQRRPDIDCIGFRGRVTFRGKHPKEFVHSLVYSDFFTRGGTYYRPPCHLNPIRRSIAARYRFAELNYYEDRDWALRMQQDGALQSEEFIDAVLYHYRSRGRWFYQWLLDQTERPRHILGLCLSNWVRRHPTVQRAPNSHERSVRTTAKPLLSVIVAVYNAEVSLASCLNAVCASEFRNFELIVVNDASIDRSLEVARKFPCILVTLQTNMGPAAARNIGVQHSSGDILFFLDADVIVRQQTLGEVFREMSGHPERDALFGSFASEPAAPGFFSDYKNLLHHYTHQNARREAVTFCGGFGAVRRQVFLAMDGFDPGWRFLEDVELGYRLHRAGYRIWLSKEILFQHAKGYTLFGLLRSDLFGRAIPWTRLMITHRIYRNDLSTRWYHLFSLPLSYALLASPAWLQAFDFWPAFPGLAATFILLNHGFFRFVLVQRGLFFCVRAVIVAWLGYLVSGAGLALGALAHCGQGLHSSRGPTPPEREA